MYTYVGTQVRETGHFEHDIGYPVETVRSLEFRAITVGKTTGRLIPVFIDGTRL